MAMRWYKIATFCVCVFVGTQNTVARQVNRVTFTGRILDHVGRPVAGTKVTAYEMLSDGIAGNIFLRPAGEMTAAEDGAFTFASPPKSERGVFFECVIVAVKPGLALGWTVWTMREDATSDIQLGAPEKLGGVIVDKAGKPVPGAEVRANLSRTVKTIGDKDKRQWLPGIAPLHELGMRTDSQGRFVFENLPSEVSVDLLVKAKGRAMIYTYKLEPREAAFRAGQTDIKVALPDEARIEGNGRGRIGRRRALRRARRCDRTPAQAVTCFLRPASRTDVSSARRRV